MKTCLFTILALGLTFLTACDDSTPSSPGRSGASKPPAKLSLQLNWVPEPEFGGFYAAQEAGLFKQRGLDVEIRKGPNPSVIQMIDRGAVDLGIVSADEIVIARSKGADLVALFTVYQDCPQGIMTHEEKGYKKLTDIFDTPGGVTLIAEPGLPYVRFLKMTFGADNLKLVPYTYNIEPFLRDANAVQQCFITSEPIQARRQGAKVTVFPIGASEFNPYTTVVVVHGDFLRQHKETLAAFVAAVREGWQNYVDDPQSTNAMMGKLNPNMDAATFAAAAEAQKSYVENAETNKYGLGAMSAERWQILIGQLVSLGLVKPNAAPAARECFVALPDAAPAATPPTGQ